MTSLSKTETKGWRIVYRYTPSERRRVLFRAPDGTTWEEVPQDKATHKRTHGRGLTPTYLRVAKV